jgi:predicted dienelactone hydrolase
MPLAATQPAFPILIMEPGMGPIPADYTVFTENLARHGYIVVGINPTDTSNLIVFPDGRLAPRTAQGTIPDSDTSAQADADGNRIEMVWAADVRFVMDQLQNMNASQASRFYNHLDLEHMGVWGHSFGGATAIAVCQQDPRCKAGADMDGTPVSSEEKAPVPQPFMFITEDYRRGGDSNCELMRQVYLNVAPGAAYSVSIADTGHFNFSDLPLRQVPLLRPLFRAAGYEGSIEPARALQITNAYLVAFFDQYLKGNQSDLLRGPATAYPEMQIEKR